ncbi:ABC transporter substrate-binding protein (plasmid) [Streptomyces sp. GDS52]|uniref:ABC transporter substrate-binding protein n=1 Tax=Streptomyces sp. GDS52 TaxID=3406419 RepID=UPI003FD15E1F
MNRTLRTAIAAVSLTLLATACSTKGSDSSAASDDGKSDVKSGVGVTADTIKLGVLTDLSGPIGPLGKAGLAGNDLYWEEQNAKGGICGRKVETIAKDNQYNVQKSVVHYASLRNEVVGIANFAGGPDVLAVQQQIKSDSMVVLPSSYDGALLKIPTTPLVGSPYDIEAINGISYLMEQKKLAEGDAIGVIHYPGGIGTNTLAGVKAAAGEFKLKLTAAEVDPTSSDLTAQVAAMKKAGAKVIVMGTAGGQTVAVSSLVHSSGYQATVLATNLISAALVKGPAQKALTENLVLTSNSSSFSANTAMVKKIREAYAKKHPGTDITAPVGAGYVFALTYHTILEKACENKDLTRDGVAKALTQVTSVDSGGMQVALNFSEPGKPASRESFILKPDPKSVDGVALVQEPKASPLALKYQSSS